MYVGRCHERDAENLLLIGVDIHKEVDNGRGEDGRTNQEFLERAAKFGIWSTHERVALKTADVESLIPLNDFFQRPDRKSASAPVTSGPEEALASVETAPQATATATVNSDQPVLLTDSASQEVRRLLAEEENRGKGLRLGVAGGGCSGLVYNVAFDNEKETDLVVPYEGFNVFLDPKSTIYLRGVILDFQRGLSGKGFQFQNPNASNTCGCGESFSV